LNNETDLKSQATCLRIDWSQAGHQLGSVADRLAGLEEQAGKEVEVVDDGDGAEQQRGGVVDGRVAVQHDHRQRVAGETEDRDRQNDRHVDDERETLVVGLGATEAAEIVEYPPRYPVSNRLQHRSRIRIFRIFFHF